MDVFTWIDADGVEHPLTAANGAKALAGADGRFMPPVSLVEEAVPDQPGARLRQVRTGVREYAQPVLFKADTEPELRAALRAWLLRLDPERGDGRVRVQDSQGGERELACRYVGGMELVEDPASSMPTWQKAVLVFRALDPYWYDAADTTREFVAGEPVTFFPFFPLSLTSSEVFALASVANGGDRESWPIWRVWGPCIDLSLRNLTTGKLLAMTHAHGAGEFIEIDTRPGVKTVTLSDGENLYPMLDAGSSLWPFERGANQVRIEMSGAGAESRVDLRYRRVFLGP